ncbi:elongation factor G [Hamadaea tsunoensis]|uniref:elongation factor G n=1 Tax=Hamadaea tsunoensis TaxID=53368 RepID=UPI000428F944|nr:TetM/TetW/TetO/TetS family tetracycline resistance ribosomal protection protein [Hamadaea tsunoensis]
MSRPILNLGILAHVDAGKTTLTERLLYAAGVIGRIGSVDAGTTQTDSLDLERRRGITIRSAVVALEIEGVAVNLIDTPGHPDFIAEVDRVLGVLDGAVLVVSAVEGVQPQTRVLMRALRRLGVPTLVFINKIDRRGADPDRVRADLTRRLGVAVVDAGTPPGEWLDVLSTHDDGLVSAYVRGEMSDDRLRAALAGQTRAGLVHPVFTGSAANGTGVAELMSGIAALLPAASGDPNAPVAGRIFKVERGAAGEKVAYLRMFEGRLHLRDRLGDGRDKATAISVFEHGTWVRRDAVGPGEIGKLWGAGSFQVGDPIGRPVRAVGGNFARPMMEAVVDARDPARRPALLVALQQLAEQDPLIAVRSDDTYHEITVSLYGEVQKEVIESTLADAYGIEVVFREATPLCVERPLRTGYAVEILNAPDNPFRATIGLRIEPAAPDSGVRFVSDVDHRSIPLYAFRNRDEFTASMETYVRQALEEGLRAWPVHDCVITLADCNYSSPDGSPATRGPLSTPADFRKLTPLVLMAALEAAGTAVCEPLAQVSLDVPVESLGPVLSLLSRLEATVEGQRVRGTEVVIDAELTATHSQELHRRLPGITSGEGTVEAVLSGYRAVRGTGPQRRRLTPDPRNREAYLAAV